jgi:hypothetical protein
MSDNSSTQGWLVRFLTLASALFLVNQASRTVAASSFSALSPDTNGNFHWFDPNPPTAPAYYRSVRLP